MTNNDNDVDNGDDGGDDDDGDYISIQVVLPCRCMMQYVVILLYSYTPSACFLIQSVEVRYDETFRFSSCLQCYCSSLLHD